MNIVQSGNEDCKKSYELFISKATARFEVEMEFLKKTKARLEHFKKTGLDPEGVLQTFIKKDSLKENPQINIKPDPEVRRTPRRTRKVLGQTHSNVNESVAHIKLEKLSIEAMPPPSLPLKATVKTEKARKPRTRAQKKTEAQESIQSDVEDTRKDSDVILNNGAIPVVEVMSDEDDKKSEESVRSSRSKSRAKRRSSSESSSRPKRTKTKKNNGTAVETSSEVSTASKNSKEDKEMPPNETPGDVVDTSKKKKQAIQRKEEEKPKRPTSYDENAKALMTDDESPEKPLTVESGMKTKQLFSPYLSSPVRKKVEAFEKLGVTTSATKTITKSSTRPKQVENSEHKQLAKSNSKESQNSTVSSQARHVLTGLSSSASKAQKPVMVNKVSTPKYGAIPKISATEYKDRELRRNRELEALKKRDELLHAQMEEKKKKREEKNQRVQKTREELEKEKLNKRLMEEKAKQEKAKQLLAEKEMKLAKLREEHEKKRLLTLKRAEERQKEKEEKKAVPVYLTEKTPLLPTADCYDSDDENAKNCSYVVKAWLKGSALLRQQRCMLAIGEEIKNTFFYRKPQTPDLQEIFEVIDAKKLKRSSSAMWHKAPRYTLLPSLNTTTECNEDDSD